MKSIFFTLLFSLFGLVGSKAQSGLFIDTSYTAEQMVMDFFANTCAMPSNVTFTGGPLAFGYFEGAGTNLGVNAGIVLSTGDVTQIANSVAYFAGTDNSAPGDADLGALNSGGFPSYNASVLEFDLTVSGDGAMDFQYVFGSEEYPEWVGSGFNDVFGFLITPPFTSVLENIALVPGANIPVSINNVNGDINSQYYVNNETAGNGDIIFDGMTTPLLATFTATGGNTYHVKIGVTDISDGIFDSGVFIGIESLCGDSLLTPPADALAIVDGNTASFENNSRYATSWHWDFGDNATSDERHPQPHTYAQNGTYTVTLTTQNWCCTDTYSFTVQVGETSGAEETGQQPFTLLPNPATGWVQLSPIGGELMDYQLLDLTGRTVLQGVATGDTKLNISGLNPGAYLFLLKNGQGVFTERLMVK